MQFILRKQFPKKERIALPRDCTMAEIKNEMQQLQLTNRSTPGKLKRLTVKHPRRFSFLIITASSLDEE